MSIIILRSICNLSNELPLYPSTEKQTRENTPIWFENLRYGSMPCVQLAGHWQPQIKKIRYLLSSIEFFKYGSYTTDLKMAEKKCCVVRRVWQDLVVPWREGKWRKLDARRRGYLSRTLSKASRRCEYLKTWVDKMAQHSVQSPALMYATVQCVEICDT